ncbi:MAG TPA: YaeQ family protein [Polyangiales bacterium]|nr:YaeQ family protein [Polyangiales bacterium]
MALTATLHTLRVALNDAERGVYETFELRIARHPSETLPYMLSRTLAYCLFWEPDIEFSRGLSTTDEPAVWVKTPDGRVKLWIDVGHPTAARLHKASKAAERVVVCTFHDPTKFQATLAGERVHRGEQIELVGLPAALVAPLESSIERRMAWELTLSGGELYLTTDSQNLSGEITRTALVASE